jgi:hypothetical protein
MAVQAAGTFMADERKDAPFQIRAARSWIARVQFAAEQLGISAAAYVRMVVTQRMNQDGVPDPSKKPKR